MAGTLVQIGRSSAADVKMNFGSLKSYKCQFTRFDVRSVTPEIDSTTFCTELNGSSDPGTTIVIVTFAGLLKTGIDASNGEALGNTMFANPFNIPSVYQFDASATIGFNANYADFTASRIAGTNAVFAGSARSVGTVVVAWPIT